MRSVFFIKMTTDLPLKKMLFEHYIKIAFHKSFCINFKMNLEQQQQQIRVQIFNILKLVKLAFFHLSH